MKTFRVSLLGAEIESLTFSRRGEFVVCQLKKGKLLLFEVKKNLLLKDFKEEANSQSTMTSTKTMATAHVTQPKKPASWMTKLCSSSQLAAFKESPWTGA